MGLGLRYRLRLLRLGLLDAADVVTRRRRPMTPSRLQVHSIGGFDFHEIGEHLASIARGAGELQPHERLLDAGCGYGRLAVPLTRFLTTGEYAGFDLNPAAIRWCRRAISTRHPNFWFAHADVANTHYNPRGRWSPAEFPFPCADASVDVAFAASLFTHLLPVPAAHYVAEMARVLKPGGRAVVSFFLFDAAMRARLLDPRVHPTFAHFPEPSYAVADPSDPEAAIAYDESTVRGFFTAAGMEVMAIHRGGWAVHPDPLSYQDFVVARKAGSNAVG